MKKANLFAIFTISCLVYAQDISVGAGWSLRGTGGGFDNLNAFDQQCIRSVWKYNGKWFAYSPDPQYAKLLSDNNISVMDSIGENEGFWVNADSSCMVKSDNDKITDFILSAGWQLKGGDTNYDIALFKKECVDIVWKYNNGWSAFSPNLKIDTLINSAGIDKIKTIGQNEGFWVKANSDCTINPNGFIWDKSDWDSVDWQ